MNQLISLAATAALTLAAAAPAVAAAAKPAGTPAAPLPLPFASGEQAGTSRIEIVAGRSTVFASGGNLNRVAVGDPRVADVKVINQRQLVLQAHAPGTTSLIVWTRDGKSRTFDVEVNLDAAAVERQVRRHIGSDDVRVSYNGGSWLLSGLASNAQRAAAEKLVATYGQPVVNLIQSTTRREQIAIDVHVVELSKTALLNFGYAVGGGEVTGVSNGVRNYVFKPGNVMTGEATAGNPASWGTIDFLAARIDALQRRGEARLLARPTLVTIDGGTAKFLAGGEVPIPIQQALGVTTVAWKEFGVRLEVNPSLGRDGTIALGVKPEVSSLDYDAGLKQANFTIPAIKTRRAETVVALASGETLMLGGLINASQARGWDGLPFIADVPVIGELFRSRRWLDDQSELAIMVTPRVISPGTPSRLPGHLGEVERDLGGGR